MRFLPISRKKRLAGGLLSALLFLSGSLQAAPAEVIGMWDEPVTLEKTTLGSDPAPKGGELRLGSVGNFDNFNPFAPRGICASFVGLTYETLGEAERTEDYIIRGFLAESFDIADDRLSMIVKLRPEARFSDGVEITSADVVWTFNALVKDANPVFRNNYRDIAGLEAVDTKTVRFTFKNGDNRELPLVAAMLPVLPSHWWQGKNIGEPQKTPMPSSGPYKIEAWNMGSTLTLKRNKDWWAQNLPQKEGRFNFDTIKVDFYRDQTVMREAFFAGNIDFFAEGTVKDWNLGYDIPAVREGKIQRADVQIPGVYGMQGLFMNTRRPVLADIRVRRALQMLFNFERINKTVFFNSFNRPVSFWTGSETMAARDPMTEAEKAILAKLPGINPSDYETLPKLQSHKTTADSRKAMRNALGLLKEAGWTLKDGVLKNAAGETMRLELILNSPSLTRNFSAYALDLARIGIKLDLVPLDQTQYYNRIRHFDYDLLLNFIRASSKPGNEQQSIWSSKSADQMGSRNYAGIQKPAVDMLLDAISKPRSREDLSNHVRVLDRILQNDVYVIPGWYSQTGHLAWWKDKVQPPGNRPPEAQRNNIFSWHSTQKALNEAQ